jgi:hypothetical protein
MGPVRLKAASKFSVLARLQKLRHLNSFYQEKRQKTLKYKIEQKRTQLAFKKSVCN